MAGEVRARLITEKFLLLAIRDWLRKLGIVSYETIKMRDGNSPPTVGTFAWDLTAPSYLSCMVKSDKYGHVKPGFVACDVFLGGELEQVGIKPFINKCVTLRKLQNVGSCLQIFIANQYLPDAFQDLKKHGIIPATPSNLFGKEVAAGLMELTQVLRNAVRSALDPNSFDRLFQALGRIEGAAIQLRGTLFEYLVADVARKTISSSVQMNRVIKLPDAREAEADVIAISDRFSVTFIECKGYHPNAEVPESLVERWLCHRVPVFYKWTLEHPDLKTLKKSFQLWTTGSLSDEALGKIEKAQKEIKQSRYTIELHLGHQILETCKSTKDYALASAFRKHFMKVYEA